PVKSGRQSPHGNFYDPKKSYQTIDKDGNVIDLPYISYTDPTKPITIDPNRKPLDFSNPSLTYDPNTGVYRDNMTGKIIEPIIEQYKKGGKVQKLAIGGPADTD